MEDANIASAKEDKPKAILIDKKIKVVPVYRTGGWLADGHDGEFMFTGTYVEFDLPISKRTGRLAGILSEEEQKFFETKLHMKPGDLSIYKKEDNFWHSFKVKVDKEGSTFDLSEPMDYLSYRVCLVSPIVAPNWNDRFASGSYKFALQDEEIVIEQKVTKANERKDAYKWLGKVESNINKMRNTLRVFGDSPAKNAKLADMYARLDELIDDPVTLPKLLTVISDPHFDMKIFIQDAVTTGAIKKTKTRYELQGGDKIGGTLQEAIDYFKDPANQDVYLTIQNQIEVSSTGNKTKK